ncbi:hypothetical protein CRENBAI_006865 [Crenichthys baileyi]|uniref:Uncharacterized protein n=1 Tax=Crenichthys baileyi TaxID=28760 RepID=A0AAV9SCA0_9TELE
MGTEIPLVHAFNCRERDAGTNRIYLHTALCSQITNHLPVYWNLGTDEPIKALFSKTPLLQLPSGKQLSEVIPRQRELRIR